MQELMLALLLWIGSHSEYKVRSIELPKVEYRSLEELYHLGYGERAKTQKNLRKIWAIYDDDTRTILLHEGFNSEDKLDQGRMTHELVHHLQVVSGKEYRCHGQSEPEAYQITELWFAHEELPLPGEWPDKEEIIFMSLCPDKDD